MTLLWQGFVLMPVVPITTKSHADAQDLGHHLQLCWRLRVMMQQGQLRSEWPVLLPDAMVMSRPELQLRVMSGSTALLQPGSMLSMPMAPVTVKGYVDVQGPHLGLCPYSS